MNAAVQSDGALWITNSVFQGGRSNSRAIHVSNENGGNTSIYLSGTLTPPAADVRMGLVVVTPGIVVLLPSFPVPGICRFLCATPAGAE